MPNKCQSKKKDGSRCGANAQPAVGLCVFHDPAKTADGHRARQAGGKNRTRLATVLPFNTPLHSLENSTDVASLLADSINQLRCGKLDPKVANATGYLASVLLRALEQGPLQERLAKIEAQLTANSQK